MYKMNLKPFAAGRFYPSIKEELQDELSNLFANAVESKNKEVIAVISPHAGYVFSGVVAASSFNQLNRDKHFDHIFIIASSHKAMFHGAALYNVGNMETPLGEVKVDMDMCDRLIRENELFIGNPNYFYEEHSIEVQLPFLQFIYNAKLKVVPIIIGTDDLNECRQLAKGLSPFFNEQNLFVFSTDFSHYPSSEDAKNIDVATLKAIISNNPNNLINALIKNNAQEINNLVTSLCGWTSILTLMFITENIENIKYEPILYQNSGDSEYGDLSRVVGYHAVMIVQENEKEDDKFLTEKAKKTLLSIARKTIVSYVVEGKHYNVDPINLPSELLQQCGVFVTLKKGDNIRGCIGRFNAGIPVYELVSKMALAASTEDHRFNPVSKGELNQIDIEISLISPLKKISDISEIEIGKHGIYIKKGIRSGTFLPEVADKMAWNAEEFLGYCCMEKMGLDWDDWKNADVYIYESFLFGENDFY